MLMTMLTTLPDRQNEKISTPLFVHWDQNCSLLISFVKRGTSDWTFVKVAEWDWEKEKRGEALESKSDSFGFLAIV